MLPVFYVAMLEYLLVPITALFLGMARGLMTCAVFCAPGLIPFVIERKSDYKDALRIGILFNLPRVIVMTLFGALFGLLLYLLGKQVSMMEAIVQLHVFAYLVLGIFLAFIGMKAFYSARKEEMEETKECRACEVCRKYAKPKKRKGDALFVVWGSLLSIACLAEVFIIDGVILTAAGAFNLPGAALAIVVGGASMLMFSIGASIPVIGLLLAASKAGNLIKTRAVLRKVKVVFGIALVFVGGYLAYIYLFEAISILYMLY